MTDVEIAVLVVAFFTVLVIQIPLPSYALTTREQAYARMTQALNELMFQVFQHTFANETQAQKNAAIAPYDQAVVTAIEDYAAFLPREQAEQVYNAIAQAEAETLQEQQQRTIDDGYSYPPNATEEQKKAIDAQEHEAWVEAVLATGH